jgi:hypothetical protein
MGIYAIVCFNQASHQPEIVGDLYDREVDAREDAQGEREATARIGRRERFAVAELDLVEEPS